MTPQRRGPTGAGLAGGAASSVPASTASARPPSVHRLDDDAPDSSQPSCHRCLSFPSNQRNAPSHLQCPARVSAALECYSQLPGDSRVARTQKGQPSGMANEWATVGQTWRVWHCFGKEKRVGIGLLGRGTGIIVLQNVRRVHHERLERQRVPYRSREGEVAPCGKPRERTERLYVCVSLVAVLRSQHEQAQLIIRKGLGRDGKR